MIENHTPNFVKNAPNPHLPIHAIVCLYKPMKNIFPLHFLYVGAGTMYCLHKAKYYPLELGKHVYHFII
jgi:hypothetical protein